MKRAITLLVLVVAALLLDGSVPPAKACMECEPAFVMINQYGTECIPTTINYDCEICNVTPDPCPPGGGHVWHRY